MTTQAAIPLKWYVPFASGDATRVEIPVTSSDPTRASQTLGFPPLTMQPPAVGGVPPQGEDFNGGMNQVARVAWWVLNGGGWPYDATFATNSNINGYPNGAVLQSADFLGQWISTADNNQVNPDTIGTNWVPGFQYGGSALTGQTGGTVTLTPLQAAKRSLTISGTLASALVVIYPAWLKDWSITNNTTGAFTVIAKTAAGSGVTIPQNGAPTPVSGDGTNITQLPQNVAPATSTTHPVQLQQVGHGQCLLTVASGTLATLLPRGGNNLIINGIPQQIPTAGVSIANTGLAASSFYYVYAFMNGSTMTLEANTTVHVTAANGIEIKSGDSTRTYVGMLGTTATSQFADNGSARLVRSWFNKSAKQFNTGGLSNSTSSTSAVLLSPATAITFVGEVGDSQSFAFDGYASSATAGGFGSVTAYINGVANGTGSGFQSSTANGNQKISSAISGAVATAGIQTGTLFGSSGNGSNCSFNFTGIGTMYG